MNTKKLVAGILCGTLLLSGTPAMAAEEMATPPMKEQSSGLCLRLLNLNLNGRVPNTQGYLYGGTPWVPLRVVADGLGMTIQWDGATRTARIDDGVRTMDFHEGESSYISWSSDPHLLGMTAPLELSDAPTIDLQGRMWVPAEAFSVLVGYEVLVGNDTLTIRKQQESRRVAE